MQSLWIYLYFYPGERLDSYRNGNSFPTDFKVMSSGSAYGSMTLAHRILVQKEALKITVKLHTGLHTCT